MESLGDERVVLGLLGPGEERLTQAWAGKDAFLKAQKWRLVMTVSQIK